jgi:5-hydroxyisourate hydrolase-like protein (transthyretin family)
MLRRGFEVSGVSAVGCQRKCKAMSLSIRVVDSVYGRSATGMQVSLSRSDEGVIREQWREQTDEDGRISGLKKPPLPRGSYTLEFYLEDYFRHLGYAPLNSAISVRFYVSSDRHHGLTLVITPSSCIVLRED